MYVDTDPNRSTLPMLPKQHAALMRFEDDMIDIAVTLDHSNRPKEVKRREIAADILRDPERTGMPLVVMARISAVPASRWDYKLRKYVPLPYAGVGPMYTADVEIKVVDKDEPKGFRTREVQAVPHVQFDGAGGVLAFGETEVLENGTTVMHSADHMCMIMWPIGKGRIFRLLPLCLAPVPRVKTWARIVKELPALELPLIQAIPHNLLGRPDTQILYLTPVGTQQFPAPKKKPTVSGKKSGAEKGDQEEATEPAPEAKEGDWFYGHVWGQTALVDPRSGIAPYDSQDPNENPYTTERVFRIKIEERRITLFYLGMKDKVRLFKGKLDLGQQWVLNAFLALGISEDQAEPNESAALAIRLAKDNFTMSNPLYAYGVGCGLVDQTETEPSELRRALARLGTLAVDTLRRELDQLIVNMADKRWRRAVLPELEDVLMGGQKPAEIYFRTSGEDFLLSWMNQDLAQEDQFRWDSYLHRMVRRNLLERLFKSGGIPTPTKEGGRKFGPAAKPASEASATTDTDTGASAKNGNGHSHDEPPKAPRAKSGRKSRGPKPVPAPQEAEADSKPAVHMTKAEQDALAEAFAKSETDPVSAPAT